MVELSNGNPPVGTSVTLGHARGRHVPRHGRQRDRTSVTMTSSGGGEVDYAVHGTIDATLVPGRSSAGTGTVTASASF
jgi:hypothetical protein